MTAVDTGWITDENPVGEWDKRKNNPPPLDDVDVNICFFKDHYLNYPF